MKCVTAKHVLSLNQRDNFVSDVEDKFEEVGHSEDWKRALGHAAPDGVWQLLQGSITEVTETHFTRLPARLHPKFMHLTNERQELLKQRWTVRQNMVDGQFGDLADEACHKLVSVTLRGISKQLGQCKVECNKTTEHQLVGKLYEAERYGKHYELHRVP